MITKEELWKLEEDNKDKFIDSQKNAIFEIIKYYANNQRRICEVPYHPLLDSFFEELLQGGLKVESRTLDKIILSWLT